MHARVIRATTAPDAMDQALEAIKSQTIPAVLQIPGFRGGYWFANRESGRVVGTVFFESKETLEASREAATRLREEVMASSGTQLAGVEEYEVFANTGEKVSRSASAGRLIFTKSDPASADAVIQQVRDIALPGVQAAAGFAGGFWMIDRDTGGGMAATLWDSAESMRASGEQMAQLRGTVMQASGAELVGVEEFEIGARTEGPA